MLRHKFQYLKTRWERIMRKLWLAFSRWRTEEKQTYFVLTFGFFFFFLLRHSITLLLPTRDKATFDGFSKDTPETWGRAGNSSQPGLHSRHHPNSQGVSAQKVIRESLLQHFPQWNCAQCIPSRNTMPGLLHAEGARYIRLRVAVGKAVRKAVIPTV